jgi:hypothetical protein
MAKAAGKMPAFMMAKFEKADKKSDKKAGVKEGSKADMKKDAKMGMAYKKGGMVKGRKGC